MNLKIAIVGSGNVASFFAKKFAAAGFTIVSVHSKNLAHAESLASEVQASASNSLSTIGSDFDYLLFAVSDDALKACIAEVPASNNFCWLHTSGAMSKEIFAEKTNQYGVFYPLQTFTKSVALSQTIFPVLIESSSEVIQQALEKLAAQMQLPFQYADSDQRKNIHLAAVFACNFSNHLFQIASQILAEQQLPFELLLPLIQETIAKLNHLSPSAAQTGPAIRNDQAVISAHIALLKEHPQWAMVYQLLSAEIQKPKQ
jgi:predicted short-subunit dehydrogenase-like oxidoreductase (DUF2520 family)